MSTDNICFHGEIRKISIYVLAEKKFTVNVLKFQTLCSILFLFLAYILLFMHLSLKMLCGMANSEDPD